MDRSRRKTADGTLTSGVTPTASRKGKTQQNFRAFSRQKCNSVHGDANDILDGFAAALRDDSLVRELQLAVLPLCFVNGNDNQRPLAAQVVHDLLERSLLAPLRRAVAEGGVDGVLLSLHGSFYAEGDDDVDGTVLARVREVVGETCVVISVK